MTRKRAATSKRQILIVDDHPIVRLGVAQMVNRENDLAICGEAADAAAMFEAIEEQHPDLVLLDLTLDYVNGMDLLKDIKIRFPHLPVLILSMHEETKYAERALRAGAKGYVMKQEKGEEILHAIRSVLAGDLYLSNAIMPQIIKNMLNNHQQELQTPDNLLSDREMEIYEMIGKGQGTRLIAERLHLSIKTVESHRVRIKSKLSLKNAIELYQNAYQWVNSQTQ